MRSHPTWSVAVLATAFLMPAAARLGAAAEPSLDDLLKLAGEYVVGYEPTFSMIVAEEEYVQRLRASPGGPVHATRMLRSDVVFVRSPGAALPWGLLRDTFEVDGVAVRDRQARLEKLLLEASPDAIARARSVADESTRFNLGRGIRNYNVPTLVLTFLHPAVQPRFAFARGKDVTIDGRVCAEIAFRERAAPTLIRAPAGDVFAAGRVFVDPHDGTVARTELSLELKDSGTVTMATLDTVYRSMPRLALFVPVEMKERWDVTLTGARGRSGTVELVDGVATYRGFRRAEVVTEEKIRSPE